MFQNIVGQVERYDGDADYINKLKGRFIELGDDVEIRPRKKYIGFIRKTNRLLPN